MYPDIPNAIPTYDTPCLIGLRELVNTQACRSNARWQPLLRLASLRGPRTPWKPCNFMHQTEAHPILSLPSEISGYNAALLSWP